MKKIVLVLLTVISLNTKAQIEKGSLLIGGNFGFGSDKTEADNIDLSKQTNYNIYPVLGFAVKQNLIAGIMLGYGYSEDKFLYNVPVQTTREQTAVSGAVFLRKYFPLSNKFYAYGQGNAGYQHFKNEQQRSPGKETFKQKIYSLNFAPGIAYELSKNFHLEAGFSELIVLYYNTKESIQENTILPGSRSETKSEGFGLQGSAYSSNQFIIGFRILLNKRKS
jgi:hypothetical protein